MTDDIIARLRDAACISCYECTCGYCEILAEAVDEIKRLRTDLDKWKCISDNLYDWTTDVLRLYINAPSIKAYRREVHDN